MCSLKKIKGIACLLILVLHCFYSVFVQGAHHHRHLDRHLAETDQSKMTRLSLPAVRVFVEPFLATVSGVATISVRQSSGLLRQSKQGDILLFGDSFLTGPNGVARVIFEGGTQVLIASHSFVTIAPPHDSQQPPVVSSHLPTYRIQLHEGAMHVLVPTSIETVPNSMDTSLYKFIVLTHAAVMGVWGTDFVVTVSADQKTTELSTIKGQVAIAFSLPSLLSNNGTEMVSEGMSVAVSLQDQKIKKPQLLNAARLIYDFHDHYPKLQPLYQTAAQDRDSNQFTEKFKKIRIAKESFLKPEE